MAVAIKRTGAPATVYLPLTLAWSLSLILGVFGLLPVIGHFFGDNGPNEDVLKAPVLLALRDELQGGDFFTENRLDIAPAHYGWLHVLPGIIWCLGIPLQNTDSVRQKFPALHRQLGYLTATCSLVLVVSGMAFPIRKHLFDTNIAYSHADLFHLHKLRLRGTTVAAWPTFNAALLLIGPIQGYTLFRAISAARAKRFAEHRTWAVYHSIAGYAIAMQRVGTLMLFGAGAVLAAIPDPVKKAWGVPLSGKDAWAAELAGFAATTWFTAALPMVVWMDWTPRHGKAVYNQKGSRKSE